MSSWKFRVLVSPDGCTVILTTGLSSGNSDRLKSKLKKTRGFAVIIDESKGKLAKFVQTVID